MGGQFEDKLELGQAEGGVLESHPHAGGLNLPAVGPLETPLRYHLKDGFVHFHEEKSKLRVAVPVAEWWRALESLKNLRDERYRYVDHDAGTMLEVTAGVNQDNQFEIIPKVHAISSGIGPIFEKLRTFTEKTRKSK